MSQLVSLIQQFWLEDQSSNSNHLKLIKVCHFLKNFHEEQKGEPVTSKN